LNSPLSKELNIKPFKKNKDKKQYNIRIYQPPILSLTCPFGKKYLLN